MNKEAKVENFRFKKDDILHDVTLIRKGHPADKGRAGQDPGGAIIVIDSVGTSANTDHPPVMKVAPCEIDLQILQDGTLVLEFDDMEHMGEQKFAARYMIQHLVCPDGKPSKLTHYLKKDLRLEVTITAFEGAPPQPRSAGR